MSPSKRAAEQAATRALVRELLTTGLEAIDAADAVVRQNRGDGVDGNPKAIKKLRIALRRIQYELSTMSEVGRSLDTGALADQLRRVGKPLGRLRDAEVLRLRVIEALGPRGTTPEGAELIASVSSAITPAREAANALLDSPEYLAALGALHELRGVMPQDGVEPTLARKVAEQAVRISWHALQRKVRRSLQNPSDANLHELRISGKRLVYVAKALSGILDVPGGEVLVQVTALQKFLGRQHDHVVAALAIGRVGAGNPSLKDLTDTLSAEELRCADDCARAWEPLWEAARNSHLRRTLL